MPPVFLCYEPQLTIAFSIKCDINLKHKRSHWPGGNQLQ